MIQREQVRGLLHGCKIANSAPVVTHLFFADDSYLFFRASLEESTCVKKCLMLYEKASGQKVNFHKSSIQFIRNTSPEIADLVSQNLQVPIRNDDFYLGLPKMVARNRWEVFKYIKEKVWNRLQSWKGKMMSRAGKEILLKSVIQAIPSYAASIFLLPDKLCEDIELLMNKFWWLSNLERQ